MSQSTPDTVETSPPDAVPLSRTLRDLTNGSAGTLILLVLVFACYAWGAQSGYIWDDDAYVANNTALRSFGGLSRIWTELGATPQYYPMTFTSFWLEWQAAGGAAPGLSHVINALLHAGSVIMLWRLLLRLRVPGAWVAAAVFAVHPINVESVAWISERKNTLSMVFALAATWMYVRYARIGVETRTQPAGEGLGVAVPDEPKRLYRLFLALFVLALLSKTAVAVLPVMLAVVLWWHRGRLTVRDLLPLVPAVVLGALAGSVTSYIEHSPDFVGATGVEWDVPLVQRVMLVGQTAAFYAYKILWPFGIVHFDATKTTIPLFPTSFNYERWTLNPASPLQWLPLAAVVAVVGGLLAGVRKLGRGPLATALLFLVALLPVSGLVTFFPMRFSWVADHFAYVASIGLIVGVVAGVAAFVGRRERLVPPAAVFTALLLVLMSAVTFWNALAYKDLTTLWKRTLGQNPRSWLAAISYGVQLMDRANYEYAQFSQGGDESTAVQRRDDIRKAAEIWFNEGIRLNPNAYEGYRSLGSLAVQRGKLDEALTQYRKAEQAAADMRAVGYRWPAFYIGDILVAQGKTEEGLAIFKQLEDLEPRLGKRNGNLFAQIRTKHGDVLKSRIKEKIAPEMSQESRDLVNDVIQQYTAATEIGPDYVPPKLKLARILADTGFYRESLQQLSDVLKLDPVNAEAKLITAQIAVSQNVYDAAAAQLLNLLSLYPRYLPAHLEYAKVLKTMGNTTEAVAELKRTLALFPGQPEATAMLTELEHSTTRPASQPAK